MLLKWIFPVLPKVTEMRYRRGGLPQNLSCSIEFLIATLFSFSLEMANAERMSQLKAQLIRSL
jgi:hypothetical protein